MSLKTGHLTAAWVATFALCAIPAPAFADHAKDGNCDVFLVKFDTAVMAGQGSPDWRHLGCHELGHTAGLGHRHASDDSNDNSCLRQGLWNATTLDLHDLDAINSSV